MLPHSAARGIRPGTSAEGSAQNGSAPPRVDEYRGAVDELVDGADGGEARRLVVGDLRPQGGGEPPAVDHLEGAVVEVPRRLVQWGGHAEGVVLGGREPVRRAQVCLPLR